MRMGYFAILGVLILADQLGGSILTGHNESPGCGDPGLPVGGQVVAEQGIRQQFATGSKVSYSCKLGWVRSGPEDRACQTNGTWSLYLPTCRLNLALSQPSLQSETLLNYEAMLAVDGDTETCSFTPSTLDQRWWQIQVQPTLIESVAVSITPGSFQHFTIFVIELLAGNKALYKPCATYEGELTVAGQEVFLCNDGLGHQGEFIYIRDDREGQQYFGLCEVQVFSMKNDSECGQPEQPVGGGVLVEESIATYSCHKGFLIIGEQTRKCQKGRWEGHEPVCSEIECPDPVSPKSGYIEVSNFKGRYQFGAVATYRCNPGFILWGNASRTCQSEGEWDGVSPTCSPISCGNPPAVVNGLVELVNGSTNWRAVATYSCLPTYSNYGDENITHVYSSCLADGNWSPVSLTCMFDPLAVSRQLKKGRSLYWETEEGPGINISTIITIGVLSALIVLSLIITIIVVSHRKASSASSTRKISRSSTNQLIHDQLGQIGKEVEEESEEDYEGKCGVIVYDDLNHPHMVETNHSTILDKFSTQNGIYQNTTLSTFSLKANGTPPGSVLGIRSPPPGLPVPHSRLAGFVGGGDRSPMSERSSGDGGSDREGPGVSHYATIGRRKRSEDIYSSMRRPDGESDDDPYSSIRVRRDSGVGEQLYETLNRQTGDGNRDMVDQERSISSETASSAGSQATVRLVSNESSQVNMADLYARVDINKKMRNRGSCDSSCTSPTRNNSTPVSPMENGPMTRSPATVSSYNDYSPTKNLIDQFNSQAAMNFNQQQQEEVEEEEIDYEVEGDVYSTVQFSEAQNGSRTPVPLPRNGRAMSMAQQKHIKTGSPAQSPGWGGKDV